MDGDALWIGGSDGVNITKNGDKGCPTINNKKNCFVIEKNKSYRQETDVLETDGGNDNDEVKLK